MTHQLEVVEKTLFAHFIFRSDVCLTQQHQIVNVIAGFEKQTSYSRIGHLFIGNYDRTHVKSYQFLNILHLFVHRQLHLPEDFGYHLFSDEIVIVEGPSRTGIPALGTRLANVVQQGSPTQPQVIGYLGDIIHNFQRVIKIILVSSSVSDLYSLKGHQLGENEFQQPAAVQVDKPFRRNRRK